MSTPARHRPHPGTWTVPTPTRRRLPRLLDAIDRATGELWFSPVWWSAWIALFLIAAVVEGAR